MICIQSKIAGQEEKDAAQHITMRENIKADIKLMRPEIQECLSEYHALHAEIARLKNACGVYAQQHQLLPSAK